MIWRQIAALTIISLRGLPRGWRRRRVGPAWGVAASVWGWGNLYAWRMDPCVFAALERKTAGTLGMTIPPTLLLLRWGSKMKNAGPAPREGWRASGSPGRVDGGVGFNVFTTIDDPLATNTPWRSAEVWFHFLSGTLFSKKSYAKSKSPAASIQNDSGLPQGPAGASGASWAAV